MFPEHVTPTEWHPKFTAFQSGLHTRSTQELAKHRAGRPSLPSGGREAAGPRDQRRRLCPMAWLRVPAPALTSCIADDLISLCLAIY